jgi:outer membrane protein assembly factor BamB
MISAEQFLDLLEKKDLLEPELIRSLRRRVAESETPVKTALIAQRLVDKGHLSETLAKRLLERVLEAGGSDSSPLSEPDESELGLVPLEEEQEEELGPIPAGKEVDGADIGATEEDDWGLEVIDDEAPAERPQQPREPQPPPRSPKSPRPQGARPAGTAPRTPASRDPQKPSDKGPRKVTVKPLEKAAPAQGSLGGLLNESSFDADATDGDALDAEPPRRGLFGSHRAKKNVWDSNLLLFGGGGLLVLGIVLAVLISILVKRNPEELLNQANELYREGSYTKAIDLYGEYLKKYSEKKGSSTAKIKLGLARMRQATAQGGNWPRALEVANEELERMSGLNMSEARAELTAMLPDIADGLSQLAREKLDPAIVEMSVDALGLVDKHVLSSARPVNRLTDIRAVLDLTRREIARGEKLLEAIEAMKAAVDEGETEEAYEIRRTLLKEYPRLIENSELRDAVLAVSEAEYDGVEVVREERKSLPTEPDATTPAALALVKRTTNATVSGSEGRVVFAVAQGAAYGLDAASGKVLWRRHVGFASDGRGVSFPSTAVSGSGGSHCVLVNWEDNEVLQLQATTGATRWRFPVGERFDAHPVAADDRLLVATRTGRLFTIDAKSGTASGYVQLPRKLRVAPVVEPKSDSIYQIGEHSSLFVLSLQSGEVKQVIYLGHEPGSVVCQPVLIRGYLVVAENDGIESSTLNVLALAAQDDQPPVRLVQQIPIKGHISTSPSVSGPRMLVVSDPGDISVFELSGDDKERPLGLIVEGKSADDDLLSGNESLIRFPFLVGGQAWVADSQLTRYDVQAARGLLQDKWIRNSGGPTLQPPMAIGETIYHVRRKLGMPGVLVAALDVDEGNTVWETQLAAPLVSEPWIDPESGRIMAVTTAGAIFSIDPAELDGNSVDVQPTAALPLTAVRRPLTDAVPLGGEAVALVIANGPDEIRIFDPESPGTRFRSLQLTGPAACRPAVFSEGLLVPLTGGQTLFLDIPGGSNRTEPFQPPLETGLRVAWKEPVPSGDGEILLTDGVAGLYRVRIQDQPEPHLAAVASAQLAEPIISPIALLGNTIHAVDKSQSLISFGLSDLKPGKPRALAARIAWGPRTVGDHVLLTTDDELLYSIDTEGKVRTGNLPHGPLAGMPISVGDHLLFASTRGVIWKINAATGEELGSVDLKLSLRTGPVLRGDRLLVGGRDGSLYQVDMP